jgi:hypothetical protein
MLYGIYLECLLIINVCFADHYVLFLFEHNEEYKMTKVAFFFRSMCFGEFLVSFLLYMRWEAVIPWPWSCFYLGKHTCSWCSLPFVLELASPRYYLTEGYQGSNILFL